jgi:hypothetical protein
LLSFLFAFVHPAEHCGLENFGSPWHAVDASFHTFRENKIDETFDDVKWLLTITQIAPIVGHAHLCHGTLANVHTY